MRFVLYGKRGSALVRALSPPIYTVRWSWHKPSKCCDELKLVKREEANENRKSVTCGKRLRCRIRMSKKAAGRMRNVRALICV